MKRTRGRIEDIDLARKMADAENSKQLEAISERRLGKKAYVVAKLLGEAHTASRKVEEAHYKESRDAAWAEIVASSTTPVIEKDLFEHFWGNGGGKVWYALKRKVDEEDGAPIEFVRLIGDECVLRGDLKAAAWGLGTNPSGLILSRLIDYLGSDMGRYMLEQQGLSPDLFAKSPTE